MLSTTTQSALTLTIGKNTAFETLSGVAGMMVSKAAYDKNGIEWARFNPVGTGPFKFERLDRDAKNDIRKER